jgi:hypothetical protein
MIGLGVQEMLVLLTLAVIVGGVVLFVVFVVSVAGRDGRRVTDLEDENRRLRDENDSIRGRG